ncbi:hypothetical protein [Halostella litorea]|uniref:hypothetical protein n=1 Tax=Halostella litorea TaxID=2528831 RepID=UPI001092D47F|nr:hypothetical protein [Halostella litorea]
MQRRELLRSLAALGAAGLAGCGRNEEGWSRRQGPPEPGDYPTPTAESTPVDPGGITVGTTPSPGRWFAFRETSYGETEDGYMTVTTTLENTDAERRAAVLVYEITADGTTYARRRTVRLDPGERVTYEFVFDVTRDEYLAADSRSISPRWESVDGP